VFLFEKIRFTELFNSSDDAVVAGFLRSSATIFLYELNSVSFYNDG